MLIRCMVFICLVISSLLSFCTEKPDSLFMVKRIKLEGNCYIINLARNDSLFKVISKKESVDDSNLEVLKKGHYYYFDFHNTNKKSRAENSVTLSSNLNYLDVKNNKFILFGDTKIKLTKRFHYRLYFTRNLIGLYYIPNHPGD